MSIIMTIKQSNSNLIIEEPIKCLSLPQQPKLIHQPNWISQNTRICILIRINPYFPTLVFLQPFLITSVNKIYKLSFQEPISSIKNTGPQKQIIKQRIKV